MSWGRTADRAVSVLLRNGADQAVAIAEEFGHVDLRWASNTLTTNGSTSGRRITVIAIIGASFAVRSATAPDDLGLDELCATAIAAARTAPPAEDAGPLPVGGVSADFDSPAVLPGSTVLEGFARDLGEVLREARRGDERVFGFARHETTTTWLATSAGTRLRHVQPEGCVEWNAKGPGAGQSVWSGQATRDFTDIDVPGTWAALRRRLEWTRTPVSLPAGRYEVILPPTAVADLMIDLYWNSGGRDALEGQTVWSSPGGGTRVGEKVAVDGLTLRSDPQETGLQQQSFLTAAQSSSLSSVFDNGLSLPATQWISEGTLAHLLQTRSTASAAGAEVTPYVHNLVMEKSGATASVEELIAKTERGLLVTSLWYLRVVDPATLLLTGLTRDGVFLIENGEVIGAVNNYRFNESPVDLLTRASEVGVTVPTLPREWSDYFVWTAMPALRIPDFHMSSVSPAS